MNYIVEIEEILRREIHIEAESESEAELKAFKQYRDCEVVLDANDFIGEPSIRCIGSI
jgi:hypothetical protein